MDSIKEESVGYLFNVEVQVEETPSIELTPTAAPAFGEAAQESAQIEAAPAAPSTPQISAKGLGPQRPQRLEYTAPSVDGEAGVVHDSEDLDEVLEVGPDASRAERRRAERAARKREKK
jgi:preprotein translocase subunit SecA